MADDQLKGYIVEAAYPQLTNLRWSPSTASPIVAQFQPGVLDVVLVDQATLSTNKSWVRVVYNPYDPPKNIKVLSPEQTHGWVYRELIHINPADHTPKPPEDTVSEPTEALVEAELDDTEPDTTHTVNHANDIQAMFQALESKVLSLEQQVSSLRSEGESSQPNSSGIMTAELQEFLELVRKHEAAYQRAKQWLS